jgi:hypothetical protein
MAKFFIPLGSHFGNDWSTFPHVYGPFEDDDAIQAEAARHWPNSKEQQLLVFAANVVSIKPSPKELPEDQKRVAGNLDNYVKVGENESEVRYECKRCGGTIMGATVAHPIHFRETPGAGSGECVYKTVPYCPNCDKEPSFHGHPVQV